MKKILAWILSAAMVLGLVGCTERPAENVPVEGAADATVKRCVIYSSSLADVLEAFGKTGCIVGAYGTLAEDHGVPSCGKWNEVDVEAVIATGADAVFCYRAYTTEEQAAILQAAGIDCHFIELSDADTAAMEVDQLGRLFGCGEKAQVFVELYEQYDALLKERLASVEPKTVYVEGTSSTPKTANQTSAAHQLVTGAGLVNLYADNGTRYPERNLEDVIVKDPDVIVKLCGSGRELAEIYDEYAAELTGVAAADAGRILLLNSECGTTAIGAVIGRLYIAKYVYPELFADVDVDAVYEQLCTDFLGRAYAGSGAFFK